MPEESLLSDEFLRQLISVGEVDILVGVPTHNHAKTIGPVVQAIQESFHTYFTRERVVIVNADGGSRDGTPEALQNAPSPVSGNQRGSYSLRTIQRVSTRYPGPPSPGQALRTILATADLLRARACAIVSPATPNLTASWLDSLLRPAY